MKSSCNSWKKEPIRIEMSKIHFLIQHFFFSLKWFHILDFFSSWLLEIKPSGLSKESYKTSEQKNEIEYKKSDASLLVY